jgi:hypothetical protein
MSWPATTRPPARLVPELRPAGHGRGRPQLGRRLRGFGAGRVRGGAVSQLSVQRGGPLGAPAGWDIVETTDGGRFERSWGYSARLELSSDSRRMVQLSGRGWWFLSMNGRPGGGRPAARQPAAGISPATGDRPGVPVRLRHPAVLRLRGCGGCRLPRRHRGPALPLRRAGLVDSCR